MPNKIEFEVSGIEELQKNFKNFSSTVIKAGILAMDSTCKKTAENISVTYRGNPGFHDITGALRASIQGGFTHSDPKNVVGQIGAGDSRIGSGGRPTKDYVVFVEFPEFRGLRKTFLTKGTKGIESGRLEVVSTKGKIRKDWTEQTSFEVRPFQAGTSFLRPGTIGNSRQIINYFTTQMSKQLNESVEGSK